MAYSDKVLDHYNNPKNVGTLDKNKLSVGTGLVGAPECFSGDTIVAIPEYPGFISLKEASIRNKPFYVWSFNIEKNKFEIKKSICLYNGKKKIVNLKIDDGSNIMVTPNHRFLTLDREYEECQNLLNVSLKQFTKTVNSRGYWEINKSVEHLEYFRSYYNDHSKFEGCFNIDHVNSNKLDNSIVNLQKLNVKDHNKKTDVNKIRSIVESELLQLSSIISMDIINEHSINYCRFEIGNLLNITTDKVKMLQSYYGISTSRKRVLKSEQYEMVSKRMTENNPYNNLTPEQKFNFASKPGEKNPRWKKISNNELINMGNRIFNLTGKLTSKDWLKHAKDNDLPQNLSARFGRFLNFKNKCINYNHKIINIIEGDEIDVFNLSVEENNNYVILTNVTLNRHSGIVVKNCGDVMRLQIEVGDDGTITDAKFKTFGCGSAIASSSLATEWLKGKSIDDAVKIDNMDIVEELNLPPVKIHCSVLAEDAIKMAINDYRKKNGMEEIKFDESAIH